MKPKDKAKDLFDAHMGFKMNPYDDIEMTLKKGIAKDHALITISEITRFPSELMYDIIWYEFKTTDMYNWSDTDNVIVVRMNALKYWQEVKKEIEAI